MSGCMYFVGNSNTNSFNYHTNDTQDQQLDFAGNELGKLFVGGLSQATNQESMTRYFSQFGLVEEAIVMMDQRTGRSRGFGYVKFVDPQSVDTVLAARPHHLDRKEIDTKQCNIHMRGKNRRSLKIFVGGVPLDMDEESIRGCFQQFGQVTDVNLMLDHTRQRHRGFAFVGFQDESTVKLLTQLHFVNMGGKQVEIKAMEPPNSEKRYDLNQSNAINYNVDSNILSQGSPVTLILPPNTTFRQPGWNIAVPGAQNGPMCHVPVVQGQHSIAMGQQPWSCLDPQGNCWMPVNSQPIILAQHVQSPNFWTPQSSQVFSPTVWQNGTTTQLPLNYMPVQQQTISSHFVNSTQQFANSNEQNWFQIINNDESIAQSDVCDKMGNNTASIEDTSTRMSSGQELESMINQNIFTPSSWDQQSDPHQPAQSDSQFKQSTGMTYPHYVPPTPAIRAAVNNCINNNNICHTVRNKSILINKSVEMAQDNSLSDTEENISPTICNLSSSDSLKPKDSDSYNCISKLSKSLNSSTYSEVISKFNNNSNNNNNNNANNGSNDVLISLEVGLEACSEIFNSGSAPHQTQTSLLKQSPPAAPSACGPLHPTQLSMSAINFSNINNNNNDIKDNKNNYIISNTAMNSKSTIKMHSFQSQFLSDSLALNQLHYQLQENAQQQIEQKNF